MHGVNARFQNFCAVKESLRAGYQEGAVYHDLGNLNFSFITRMKVPNKEQGYEVIQRAVGSLGIRCAYGKNDLTVLDGRKFSGNAFRYENGVFLHHGTLLIPPTPSNMSRYLNPSFEKIESRGEKHKRKGHKPLRA